MSLDWTALSDGELATLSLAGRQAAFAEILRRYRQPVFRLVRAFVGNGEDALDVTQEAFVAAHQALARYDPDRPMQAWLTTIAVNKSRDWARKRAVRRFLSFGMPDDDRVAAIPDDQPGPDESAADRQQLARVRRAIATLPANLKEPLVLRTIEGLSQAETAELLGISQKAVETRLYRARARLIEKLR